MRKLVLFLVIMSLLVASASAQAGPKGGKEVAQPPNPELYQEGQGTGQGTQEQTETMTQEQNKGEDMQVQTKEQAELTAVPVQAQGKLAQGTYSVEGGKQLRVEQKDADKIMLKSGDVTADTEMEMTQEQDQQQTKLKVKLSNGKNAEIKVMPDTASERALERLRLKVCSSDNNCTIELKEVGSGQEVKAAYEVRAEKEAKVLGMFKTRMKVQAQVDAETGEVISSKKPWWAFMATEPEQ
ncbi:hypothetical protein KY363_00225 [Candidatus Woesearchaeota archaeon]|nr:hypothetical protein [Candidatus Woesearchaeota archaeon]